MKEDALGLFSKNAQASNTFSRLFLEISIFIFFLSFRLLIFGGLSPTDEYIVPRIAWFVKRFFEKIKKFFSGCSERLLYEGEIGFSG